MKLYVWVCSLDEWTNGLAVAMANSKEEAVQLLIRRGLPEHYFTHDGGIMTEDSIIYPIVHERPAAAFVFGGR